VQASGLRASWLAWPGKIRFISVGFWREKIRELRECENCRGFHKIIGGGTEIPRLGIGNSLKAQVGNMWYLSNKNIFQFSSSAENENICVEMYKTFQGFSHIQYCGTHQSMSPTIMCKLCVSSVKVYEFLSHSLFLLVYFI
jgi:hypothetical protein